MSEKTLVELRRLIRGVPDFPSPGILFRDITPLLAEPRSFAASIALLAELIRPHGAEEILAIESRGFVFGAALARELHLPLQIARKPGKLPRTTRAAAYELEYGRDSLEIHADALRGGVRYAIVDDLIATGGTAAAARRLVEDSGSVLACCAFLIELTSLEGRRRLDGAAVESLIDYD